VSFPMFCATHFRVILKPVFSNNFIITFSVCRCRCVVELLRTYASM
jgi:hypothetical protein